MTFKPKFEDFESVTKTIGDGSQVDQLLVHVYEEGSDQFEEKTYDITSCQVQQEVKIPFYYGKKYKVYFWAYKSGNDSPYTISPNGLKGGVSVEYPDGALDFDALESLDAFYAVSDVDLSNGRTMDINLTRPFAQVNLVADKEELLNAQASKVEFTINVAETFNLTSPTSEGTTGKTFTFTSTDNFQSTEEINGNVYLGTTYLFVPSSGKVTGKVKLYAGDNVLKSAENIEIPLVGNKRTNLVFSGFQVTVPDWDPSKESVPRPSDGWITITEPEQLAALLMAGTTESKQVRIGEPLNMEKMPAEVKSDIAGKSFNGLTLDGNGLTIKNYEAPAFFATATNLNVSNLTLENVKISAATHVGVLVNELHGNGTFTNVTVKDSYAVTTNGAAGGVVGYIRRTTEKDRAESLDVLFEDCNIIGSNVYNIAVGTQAEGKFVGLFSGYDNGEKLVFTSCSADANATVADYPSRYVEGNESEWLETNDYTIYDGFLGEETYNRGTIIFGANQFVPMWDGVKQVPLMDAITEYDGWSSGKVIYSAFDLASLQGLKSTSGNYYLCADVDLGGDGKDGQVGKLDKDRNMLECGADDALFNPINHIANLNGVKKDKIGTEQASLTESDNYSIYNCKVVLDKHDGIGAGFIKQVTGTTNHSNINLIRAYVYNHHDETLPEQKYFEEDNGSGNAYAGTFVSSAGGTYNISNVHVSFGHVMAVCKIGGIIGRVSGVLNMSNCTVHNHTVENWEANIINWYPMAMPLSDWMVYINQSWYTQGECGGLIGFIKSMSATIDNCSVTDTDINCYGQPDKQVTAGVYMSGWTSIEAAGPNPGGIKGYTIIAGRHVNQFIGDVVSERTESRANSSDYTVTIKDYYVSGNKYFGVPVTSASSVKLPEINDHSAPRTILYNSQPTSHAYGFSYTSRRYSWSLFEGSKYAYTHTVNSFCDCVGSAYYVGVDVKVSIIINVEKHVRHCAGTLVFNEKGKSAVTVTEAINDGNNIAWTGGDFWM